MLVSTNSAGCCSFTAAAYDVPAALCTHSNSQVVTTPCIDHIRQCACACWHQVLHRTHTNGKHHRGSKSMPCFSMDAAYGTARRAQSKQLLYIPHW
jgi:hypothetical protein